MLPGKEDRRSAFVNLKRAVSRIILLTAKHKTAGAA